MQIGSEIGGAAEGRIGSDRIGQNRLSHAHAETRAKNELNRISNREIIVLDDRRLGYPELNSSENGIWYQRHPGDGLYLIDHQNYWRT